MKKSINLFEYQNKEPFNDQLKGLEAFLDGIWQNREKVDWYGDSSDKKEEAQRFIDFIHRSGQKYMKSNKYVGVIHFEGQRINLLPKVFYNEEWSQEVVDKKVPIMQQHILWWLSYCRKIKFPNYELGTGRQKSDFFEVLIYLFAKYTLDLMQHSIFQQYTEVSRELPYVKGRLNIPRYSNDNIARGRWHKLSCDYDSFEMDNAFNRIVKSVASTLLNVSNNQNNKKLLGNILFILDEVRDTNATLQACEAIQFNPMFKSFETVMDYCKLFLSNSVSFDHKKDLKLFAFLLPMEYVFEDFVFGFIEKEIKQVNASAQNTEVSLDKERKYALRPDLILNINKGETSKRIIADTKYKLLFNQKGKPKRLSQADLYQMLAYAVRYKIKHIELFYPESLSGSEDSKELKQLHIIDEFSGTEVTIIPRCLPFIDRELLEEDPDTNSSLGDLFEPLKKRLVGALEEIFEFIRQKEIEEIGYNKNIYSENWC